MLISLVERNNLFLSFAKSAQLSFLPGHLLVTAQVICVSLISPENTGFIVLHLQLKCIYIDNNIERNQSN